MIVLVSTCMYMKSKLFYGYSYNIETSICCIVTRKRYTVKKS